jgi:hypothetical protein
MKKGRWMVTIFAGLVSAHLGLAVPARAQEKPATPEELVAAYDSLANTILDAKKAERHMVLSILSATYRRAETTLEQAKTKIRAGEDARSDIEALAALVAQLGNEGDAAVAGIRKRLIEGGHHHNAAGEQQGLYEEGFVIVTRAAKKVFLGCAGEIGKLGTAPDAGALDVQWQKVATQYGELVKPE